MLLAERQPGSGRVAAYALKAPELPADADAVGQEPERAAADVERRDGPRDVEHVERRRRPDAHQPEASYHVRPQRVLRAMVRRRDDHVAADRRHAAQHHQMLVALEEAGRVGDIDLHPQHFAEERRARAEGQVRVASGELRVHERGRAGERRADKRSNLAILRERARGCKQNARQHNRARRGGADAHRAKMERNSRANGETVTSPADSANGRASPWLLASRISVSPRRGRIRIIDDDALSLTPNCQTIFSLLYCCTNQPYACGSARPFASVGGVHSSASPSGRTMKPFFSPRSNCSRSRTVAINPDAGVNVVAT